MPKKHSHSYKMYSFKALQISLGIIVLLFAFLERMPSSSTISLSSSKTVSDDTDTLLLSNPTVQVQHSNDSNVVKYQEKRILIHPWIPALTMAQIKPVLREAAVLFFLQAVGVPLIGKVRAQVLVGVRYLIPLQRRFRFLPKVLLSPKVGRFLQRHSRRIWKILLTGYHKTSASRLVNRCKKYLHVFFHSHDHEHSDRHAKEHHSEICKKHSNGCSAK
jgi:hypothetical protein